MQAAYLCSKGTPTIRFMVFFHAWSLSVSRWWIGCWISSAYRPALKAGHETWQNRRLDWIFL